MVERLFLTVPRGCLQFVIVVFPDHTHLLFLAELSLLDNVIGAIISCAGSYMACEFYSAFKVLV